MDLIYDRLKSAEDMGVMGMHAGTVSFPETPEVRDTQKRFGAGVAVLAFVSYLGAQILTGMVLGFVEGFRVALRGGMVNNPATFKEVQRTIEVPSVVGGTIVAGIVLLLLIRRFAGASASDRSTYGVAWARGTNRSLANGLALGAMLGLGYLLLASLIPPTTDFPLNPFSRWASWTNRQATIMLLTVLLVIPPLEELLFRGVLFSGLSRRWGPVAGGIASTALFVLPHLPQTSGYWPAMLAITMLGVTTLAIRLRSSALGPAVALHFAYNAILMASLPEF